MNARQRSTVYGMAAVDSHGRIADQSVRRALGWVPGDRLNVRVTGGLITVAADAGGPLAVSGQGWVRLPASARYACRIVPGDRVLLAAEPADGILLVHPLTTVDAMVAHFHDHVLTGGAA